MSKRIDIPNVEALAKKTKQKFNKKVEDLIRTIESISGGTKDTDMVGKMSVIAAHLRDRVRMRASHGKPNIDRAREVVAAVEKMNALLPSGGNGGDPVNGSSSKSDGPNYQGVFTAARDVIGRTLSGGVDLDGSARAVYQRAAGEFSDINRVLVAGKSPENLEEQVERVQTICKNLCKQMGEEEPDWEAILGDDPVDNVTGSGDGKGGLFGSDVEPQEPTDGPFLEERQTLYRAFMAILEAQEEDDGLSEEHAVQMLGHLKKFSAAMVVLEGDSSTSKEEEAVTKAEETLKILSGDENPGQGGGNDLDPEEIYGKVMGQAVKVDLYGQGFFTKVIIDFPAEVKSFQNEAYQAVVDHTSEKSLVRQVGAIQGGRKVYMLLPWKANQGKSVLGRWKAMEKTAATHARNMIANALGLPIMSLTLIGVDSLVETDEGGGGLGKKKKGVAAAVIAAFRKEGEDKDLCPGVTTRVLYNPAPILSKMGKSTAYTSQFDKANRLRVIAYGSSKRSLVVLFSWETSKEDCAKFDKWWLRRSKKRKADLVAEMAQFLGVGSITFDLREFEAQEPTDPELPERPGRLTAVAGGEAMDDGELLGSIKDDLIGDEEVLDILVRIHLSRINGSDSEGLLGRLFEIMDGFQDDHRDQIKEAALKDVDEEDLIRRKIVELL